VLLGAVASDFVATSARPLLVAGLLCGWLLVSAAAEVAALANGLRRSSSLGRPARPADGVVELAALRDARLELNPVDTRFGRMVELVAATAADRASVAVHGTPVLRGEVVLVSFFIGRDGASWSPREIAGALRSVERAAVWIERQAIDWQAPVNVKLLDAYFAGDDPQRDDVVIEAVAEAHQPGLFEAHAVDQVLASASRVATALGFSGIADLVERAGQRIEADWTVWLLHPRSEGRSHAIAADVTPLPGTILAVCYAREDNFRSRLRGAPAVDSVTVAHEILHLFGASDKYGASLASFPRGQVTGADIMVLDQRSLARMRVDPLTAYEVGWPSNEQRPAGPFGMLGVDRV
jgi:hypothetical protein